MKSAFTLTCASALYLVLLGPAIAGDGVALVERLRGVVPAGWEVGRGKGTAVITVTRAEIVPSHDLTLKAIPSSPAFGEGSMHYAGTNGIRVWFYIESVGTCSDTEYLWRQSQNSNIWVQLAPLSPKIERIPHMPRVKPSFLSRAPRNQEEQSWLNEYNRLWGELQILPTHHQNSDAFLISLLKSYAGAQIQAAEVRKEIEGVQKAIETVLVPYERQKNPQPTDAHDGVPAAHDP